MRVKSATCTEDWIYVGLPTAHGAKIDGTFPEIGLEVFYICIVIRTHFLWLRVQTCKFVSPFHMCEVKNCDLFSIILRVGHWHVIKLNEPFLIGSIHRFKDRVLSWSLAHAKRWNSFLSGSCSIGSHSLCRFKQFAFQLGIHVDATCLWVFVTQLSDSSQKFGVLRKLMRLARCDWTLARCNARTLSTLIRAKVGISYLVLSQFRSSQITGSPGSSDRSAAFICTWLACFIDAISMQVIRPHRVNASRPWELLLTVPPLRCLHMVPHDDSFNSFDWIIAGLVITLWAKRRCCQRASFSFDRLKHVLASLSMNKLGGIALKVQRAPFNLIRWKCKLLGDVWLDWCELGVVFVRTDVRVVEGPALL